MAFFFGPRDWLPPASAGHTRWKPVLKLGLKTVLIRAATNLASAQLRACRVAENRTPEQAEWDVELLPIELGELRDEGVEVKLVGFSEKELAEYLGEFDTDLEEGRPGPEEAGETIRCPKCGHEFACPVFDPEAQTRRERGRRAKR